MDTNLPKNLSELVPDNKELIVFFDGSCPMCRREIEYYKGMKGADKIDWLDITSPAINVELFGLSHETAMARFHTLDSSGKWHTGAYGFVALWRHLNALKWASFTIKKLYLTAFLDRIYIVFAKWRLSKNKVCNDESCTSTKQ